MHTERKSRNKGSPHPTKSDDEEYEDDHEKEDYTEEDFEEYKEEGKVSRIKKSPVERKKTANIVTRFPFLKDVTLPPPSPFFAKAKSRFQPKAGLTLGAKIGLNYKYRTPTINGQKKTGK